MNQAHTQQLKQAMPEQVRLGAPAELPEPGHGRAGAGRPGPQSSETLHHLGILKARQGLYAEGIRLVEQAIIKSPSVSSYYNDLGALRLQNGDVMGAEKSFRYALQLDRRNVEAQLNLGRLLEDQTNWIDAHACFSAALRIAPDSVAAHSSLARLNAAAGDDRF